MKRYLAALLAAVMLLGTLAGCSESKTAPEETSGQNTGGTPVDPSVPAVEEETETDILGGVNLRVNHNKRFYTEWYTGTAIYFRPDNLSNEYNDIYLGVNAHFGF